MLLVTPPCLVPAGMDPGVLDGTEGDLRMKVQGDTTEASFTVRGMDPNWVVTAWVSYFFPGPGVIPPDTIFGGPDDAAVAAVSAPVAPTTAAFTEGMGAEPNQLSINPAGRGELKIDLDYNPLEAGQGPLRNDVVATHQADAPAGSIAEQATCCGGVVQRVGGSYLRKYDADGAQVFDANGLPELVRSPVPVAFMVLIIHTDGMTHGIYPGVPIFPFPGVPETAGDHFVLGIFDLIDL